MSSCCRSRPLSPGSWTSNTRQLGTSGLGKAKNSCAEGKVCTVNPSNRIRLPRALRTDSSSSTTYTRALVLLINHHLLIEKDSSKTPPTRTPGHSLFRKPETRTSHSLNISVIFFSPPYRISRSSLFLSESVRFESDVDCIQ